MRIIPTIIIAATWNVLMAKDNYEIRSSDFSVVAKSRYFVDKTLFLKAFLKKSDSTVEMVTAPCKFGKSTILDMVKRFVGFVVDRDGKQVAPETTANYRLFCDNNLNVCKRKPFVKTHLGQYPVIHVRYGLLFRTKEGTFESFFRKLRLVVRSTFEEHVYLKDNSSLFPVNGSREFFIKHCTPISVDSLTGPKILAALPWLSELLYKHFGKKTVVLMDDYDAYAGYLLLREYDNKKNNNARRVMAYLDGIIDRLLKYNTYLEKALVFGILRGSGEGGGRDKSQLRNYRFLGKHKYSNYFGFTDDTIGTILEKNIRKKHLPKLNESKIIIEKYYNGYVTQGLSTRIYNAWSVIQFIENKLKPMNYLPKSQYREGIYDCAKVFNISVLIQNLMRGGSVHAKLDTPLAVPSLLKINKINNFLLDDKGDIDVYSRFFYNIGYFSPLPGASPNKKTAELIIPNNEIRMEFATVLTETYKRGLGFLGKYVRAYQKSFDHFTLEKNFTVACQLFHRAVQTLFTNSRFRPWSQSDVQAVIFSFAAQKLLITNSKYTSKDFHKTEVCQMILTNSYGTTFFISAQYQETEYEMKLYVKKKYWMPQLAKVLLNNIIANNPHTVEIKNKEDAVYIGLGFDEDTRNISIACSSVSSKLLVMINNNTIETTSTS